MEPTSPRESTSVSYYVLFVLHLKSGWSILPSKSEYSYDSFKA